MSTDEKLYLGRNIFRMVIGAAVVGVYLYQVATGQVDAAQFSEIAATALAAYLVLDGGVKTLAG